MRMSLSKAIIRRLLLRSLSSRNSWQLPSQFAVGPRTVVHTLSIYRSSSSVECWICAPRTDVLLSIKFPNSHDGKACQARLEFRT